MRKTYYTNPSKLKNKFFVPTYTSERFFYLAKKGNFERRFFQKMEEFNIYG